MTKLSKLNLLGCLSMVLLIEKISKLYSKLGNHHHHHHHHHHKSEALSASFQAFQSDVSNILNQLSLNSKPGSEILSLPWILQCFGLLPSIHRAFAKLVVDIDYPISKWEAASVEEYLNYSLSLMELFNSMSSSVAYLGHARLSLAHALSLVENSPTLAIERLKAIQPRSFNKDFKEGKVKEDGKERTCSGEERNIHQALTDMKSIGFWVCGIVLSGLCSDGKPYLEMRKLVCGLLNSSFDGFDSSIYEVVMEQKGALKEVKDLNDTVACLNAALVEGENSEATKDLEGKLEAAKDLERKLEVFEKLLESLQKEVDHLFSEVLAGRSKLLDCLRPQKE